MDYLQELKDSFEFVWKNKFTLIFGFMISLTSISGEFSSNFPDTNSFGFLGEPDIQNQIADNGELFLLIGAGLGLVFFILSVLFWILSRVSELGLIKSVKMNLQGETPMLSNTWKYGLKRLLPVIIIDVLLFFVVFLLMIPFIVGILIFFFSAYNTSNSDEVTPLLAVGLICIGGLYLLFITIFATLMSILASNAKRLLVRDDNLGAIQSLRQSWQLFRSRFRDLFIASLYGILPALANGAVAIIGLLLTLPILFFGIISFIGIATTQPVGLTILMILIGSLVFILFFSILLTPIRTVTHVYWSRVILKFAE